MPVGIVLILVVPNKKWGDDKRKKNRWILQKPFWNTIRGTKTKSQIRLKFRKRTEKSAKSAKSKK